MERWEESEIVGDQSSVTAKFNTGFWSGYWERKENGEL